MEAGDRDEDVRELETLLRDRLGGYWVGWRGGPAGIDGATMVSQFKPSADGRPVLTGLLLLGDAITSEALRRVPVAALENSQQLGILYGSEPPTMGEDRVREVLAKLPPLERTDGMAPDEFSQLVARHYRAWAKYVSHPAAAMAADLGVKSPTVHGWIREARLRGHLPKARRGKRAES